MFKVTGVSRRTGVFKVRFAQDMSRLDVFTKNHHDEIQLVEMPTAADKAGCVKFLKTTDLYNRPEYKEAIDEADTKYSGSPTVSVSSKPKIATAKSTKPSLEAIKARAVKAIASNNSSALPGLPVTEEINS
jgi:hypothetical protein